jgi:hypothetical protein
MKLFDIWFKDHHFRDYDSLENLFGGLPSTPGFGRDGELYFASFNYNPCTLSDDIITALTSIKPFNIVVVNIEVYDIDDHNP